MLFWVNLHGGFLLGFALLGVYFVGGVIRYFSCPEQRAEIASRLRRLGLVSVLTLLASFVNPYGYKLHLHIYRYLSDRFLMNHVTEFQSPDFHGVAQQCFAVMLLITIAALASARRKPGPTHLLVILLAAYSGLYAARNLPVSSMLLTLMIAPVLSETVATGKREHGDRALAARSAFPREQLRHSHGKTGATFSRSPLDCARVRSRFVGLHARRKARFGSAQSMRISMTNAFRLRRPK